jgi:hypothetical protein
MSVRDLAHMPPNPGLYAPPAGPQEAAPARICVDVVEIVSSARGRRVRAVVQLGRLSPADVRVEFVPVPPAGGVAALRMWSSQAYGNGRFVFEAELDAAAGADATWQVYVRPAVDR